MELDADAMVRESGQQIAVLAARCQILAGEKATLEKRVAQLQQELEECRSKDSR